MPAIKIFCNLTTAPLASDDMVSFPPLAVCKYEILQFLHNTHNIITQHVAPSMIAHSMPNFGPISYHSIYVGIWEARLCRLFTICSQIFTSLPTSCTHHIKNIDAFYHLWYTIILLHWMGDIWLSTAYLIGVLNTRMYRLSQAALCQYWRDSLR